MTTRTESMQRWERAEIERSSVEATLTPDESLRVSAQTFARYARPAADTPYPLEYAYHLLGDVNGQRVIDFGCGSGANSALLTGRGARVWAIDISGDLLQLAQRRLVVSGRGGGATFIAGSAHDLPFPDGSIDVVFGIAILHHLDLDLVGREVRRVLKPGGTLHLLDFGGAGAPPRGVLARVLHLGQHAADNFHGRIPALMAEAGLAAAREVGHGATLFGPIAWYRASAV
jgi:SAM-dependent methyltransferase